MSLGSTLFAAFGSDKPNLKKIEIVKSQPIQEQIDRGVGSNRELMDLSDESVANFLAAFRGNTPRLQGFADEGIREVSGIYSGRLGDQLRNLRTERKAARGMATERALKQITAADKARAARMGVPGQSSYRDFMKARLTRDAMIDAELEDTAQARSDYMTELGQRLGNLGTRQALIAPLEQRMGSEVVKAGGMRGIPLQNLAALSQLDQANKWYGLYRKRSGLERFADADDESLNTIAQVAGIAGNVAGMAMACWVARAVYGNEDHRWRLFRQWLFSKAPIKFVAWYLQNGQAFAEQVKRDPKLKATIRRLMDEKILELQHV